MGDEGRCTLLRLGLLLLVVRLGAEGMMDVVGLRHQVGDRVLHHRGLRARHGIVGDEAEAWREVVENHSGLREQHLAVNEDRRREGRRRSVREPTRLVGHVFEGCAGGLEGQAHVLAASRQARPIVELILRTRSIFSGRHIPRKRQGASDFFC